MALEELDLETALRQGCCREGLRHYDIQPKIGRQALDQGAVREETELAQDRVYALSRLALHYGGTFAGPPIEQAALNKKGKEARGVAPRGMTSWFNRCASAPVTDPATPRAAPSILSHSTTAELV